MGFWDKAKGLFTIRTAKEGGAGVLPPPRSMSGYGSLHGYGTGRLTAFIVGLLPGTNHDYAREAGDLTLNSAVAVCLAFYSDNWPQGRLRVVRMVKGQKTYVDNHPVLSLFHAPAPGVPASLFWTWIIDDYFIKGNGFLRKVRGAAGFGEPVQLQYLPADMVGPMGDARTGEMLTHYEYRPDGRRFTIPLADICHIRQGRDVNDIRMGRARLVAGLREIVADNNGSTLAGAMSRNSGVATTLIGPSMAAAAGMDLPTADEARVVGKNIGEQIKGDNAGGIAVIEGPFQAERLSFSPRDMALDEMRKKPEERIAALFRIPPVVVGFGAGLDRSTYNNMAEARQMAWEDGILPVMALFADFLTLSFLPDYSETQAGDYLEFDTSSVRVLMDDETAKRKSAGELYKSKVCDRAQAKRIAGLEATDEDEGVYFDASSSEPDPFANQDNNPPPTTKAPKKAPAKKSVKDTASPVMQDIFTLLDEFRTARNTGEAKAVSAISNALNVVVADLEARILAFEKSLPVSGMVSESAIWHNQRLAELLTQTNAAIAGMSDEAGKVLTASQKEQIKLGSDVSVSLMKKVGEAASITPSFATLPLATLETLAGFMADGSPIANHFANLGAETVAKMREILVASVARGAGAAEIARELRGALGLTKNQALTIARTEPLRAGREATRQQFVANRHIVSGYLRLSATDARVCAACWALHGTAYTVDTIMPTHPCCRCALVPTIEGADIDVGDRDALFEALTEKEQKDVLGAQGFEAWQGGVGLNNFAVVSNHPKWGPTVRTATLQELGVGN